MYFYETYEGAVEYFRLEGLIADLEFFMEQAWTDYANGETPTDRVGLVVEEICACGIGAVYVRTQSGNRAWLCLETLAF